MCPETSCGLRSHCRQVWQVVQIRIAQDSKKPRSQAGWRKRKATKVRVGPKRDHKRVKYVPQGRHVDELVEEWRKVFHDLPIVEEWTSNSWIGAPKMRVCKNYHSVVVNGTIVGRMWTDTPKRSRVDFPPDLVNRMVDLAVELEDGAIVKPTKIPDTYIKKSLPCTHRIKIKGRDTARRVAEIIRAKYVEGALASNESESTS